MTDEELMKRVHRIDAVASSLVISILVGGGLSILLMALALISLTRGH